MLNQDGDRTKHHADFNIKLETKEWLFAMEELLSVAVDSFVRYAACITNKILFTGIIFA